MMHKQQTSPFSEMLARLGKLLSNDAASPLSEMLARLGKLLSDDEPSLLSKMLARLGKLLTQRRRSVAVRLRKRTDRQTDYGKPSFTLLCVEKKLIFTLLAPVV
jgi:hypothetical protein